MNFATKYRHSWIYAVNVGTHTKKLGSKIHVNQGYLLSSTKGEENRMELGCPVNWYSLSISIPDFSDCPIKKI